MQEIEQMESYNSIMNKKYLKEYVSDIYIASKDVNWNAICFLTKDLNIAIIDNETKYYIKGEPKFKL